MRIGIKGPGLLESELDSESELESLATEIGIRIGIVDLVKPWNRNQSQNQP